MAVSSNFNVKNYLEIAFTFLSEFSWIYDEKNIDVFTRNVLQKIPNEWITSLKSLDITELLGIPLGFLKEEWPASLKQFVERANSIGELRYSWNFPEDCSFTPNDIEVPKSISKSTAKKLNEVKCISAIVGHFAAKYNCGTIIDVGSGFGYPGQLLHHNFNLLTIGLESVEERSARASEQVKEGSCTKNVHNVNLHIEDTVECKMKLSSIIHDAINDLSDCGCGKHNLSLDENSRKNILVIGLHSCGNLLQDMMKLFCQIPELKLFIVAGCCYHKTPLDEFPLSGQAKEILNAMNGNWMPCTTGLRLGCQMTRLNWTSLTKEEHTLQQRSFFYRALFEYFLQKKNLTWKKPKRHLRKHRDMQSIETFLCVAFQNSELPESEKETYIDQFRKIVQDNQHLYQPLKILDMLQMLLQPIWEAVVLVDRIAYFSENSATAQIFKMCDELVTPRNLLLFGIKNQ